MKHPITRLGTALALPALALGIAACDDDDPTGVDPDPTVTFQSSFEQGRAGFQADTADMGNPPVDWTVERSTARADDGSASMRIAIDNVNDQAKVWIERAFADLDPNTLYDVDVAFDFATADWGTVNLWTLLVDAAPESPETFADFEDAHMEDTGNGADEDVGFVWEAKRADFAVETDADGTLHVAIGVWGTYEVSRSYFIDEVEVTITER